MPDILLRFPVDISYQILSNLSDSEKIRITVVSKAWKQLLQKWLRAHENAIYKKYSSILSNPTSEWGYFTKTVELAAFLRPLARPTCQVGTYSEELGTYTNIKAQYVSVGKYAAWVDGKVFRAGTFKQVGPDKRAQLLNFRADLSALASVPDGCFGEVWHIDEKTGIVLVGLYITVTRTVYVMQAQEDEQEDVTILLGYVLFNIPREKTLWVTNAEGGTKGISIKACLATDWYHHGRGSTKHFSGPFLIRASSDEEQRTSQLWKIDLETGNQRCIQPDMLGHSTFSRSQQDEARYEPPWTALDGPTIAGNFRNHYRADQFDIQTLPFKNSKGECDYVAVCYGFDFTGHILSEAITGEFPGELVDEKVPRPDGADGGEYVEKTYVLHHPAGGESLLSDEQREAMLAANPTIAPEEAQQLQSTIIQNGTFGVQPPPGICQTVAEAIVSSQTIMFPLRKPDGKRLAEPVEGSRCFLLIYNVTTGELVQHFRLPAYKRRLQNNIQEDVRYGGQEKVMLDILDGRHPHQVRYQTSMNMYCREPIEAPASPSFESVRLDIVQYSKVQPIVRDSLRPAELPFNLPESWTMTLNFNKSTQAFSLADTTNILYGIVTTGPDLPRHPLHLPMRQSHIAINPLFNIGLYNSTALGYDHNDPELFANLSTVASASEGEVRIFRQMPDVPNGCDMLAEIVQFEEDEERRTELVKERDDGGVTVWQRKWMKVQEREGIYLPENCKRIGWGTKKCGVTQPVSIDEEGIKFGGLWVY
ncbi:hypothetical protein BJ508DRAFT_418111, partial [Ascobolus immersus RN42]